MITNRQLKLELLKDQNVYSRITGKVLASLSQSDPQSYLLPLEKAIASRNLVQKLWDALPDESYSYQFEDIGLQATKGRDYIPTANFNETVTLHLGWDVLAFSCSLEAAWQCWQYFGTLNTDTFNCCIYPEQLEWFVVRAGNNLYPMLYSPAGYELFSGKGFS